MRHAILILAHKNIGAIMQVGRIFLEKVATYSIHIDKSNPSHAKRKKSCVVTKQVKVVSREYDVNWGHKRIESEMHQFAYGWCNAAMPITSILSADKTTQLVR